MNVRDRWIIVLLLLFATAGVIPQLGGTTGNVIALIGITVIGVFCALKSYSLSTLRFPFTIFLLLAVFLVLRAIVSAIRIEDTTIIRSMRPAVYLLVPTITVLIVPNSIKSREAIIGSLITVTLISGIGILGIIIGSPIAGIHLTEYGPVDEYIIFGERELRPIAISIFENPNRLSAFAIAGIIGGGGIWHIEKKGYGLFAVVIAVLTVILTGSRTPFFAIPMALVVAILLWCDLREVLLLWIGMFSIAVPAIVLTTVVDISLVGLLSQARAEIWSGAVRAIFERPLFGYGLGNSATGMQDFVPTNWVGSQPHNSFVKIAVSGGVPLAILYIFLMFGSIISRARVGVSKETSIWLVLSVGYLSIQVFESFSIFSLTPTCILIGLSTGYIMHNQKGIEAGENNNCET